MAGAFSRTLIVLGRVKYALQRPVYLRTEFIIMRQELSARRMTIFW